MALCVIVCGAFGPEAATAQTYKAPRTPWGAPSFDGLWDNNTLTEFERPEAFKSLVISEAEAAAFEAKRRGKPPEIPNDTVGGSTSEWWETDVGMTRIRGQVRTSWIVSPADGQLPFTAAAKAANKARSARRKIDFDHPESRGASERCIASDAAGPPMVNAAYNNNFQFVQTPDALAIWSEYHSNVRIIRLAPGAVHPAKSIRRVNGDSIGHWEGETLVVDTTNFTAREVGGDGKDLNADMQVTERLTRLSDDVFAYAFTVHDPADFIQPWLGEAVFRRSKGPIYEVACHEGNYALPSMLSAARQAEAQGLAAAPAAAK